MDTSNSYSFLAKSCFFLTPKGKPCFREHMFLFKFISCLDANIYHILIMWQSAKYLLQSLNNYESAVGDSNIKTAPHIEVFPPAFQVIPRNPIVLDIAFNFIDFPSLENRMKKDRKGFISRLWGWVPLAIFFFHLRSSLFYTVFVSETTVSIL